MIIYAAIDLRGGRVVRLRGGNASQETIFSEDPEAVARNWCEQGAEWLHVVNLDGAFERANNTLETVQRLVPLVPNIQFGGGLRTLDDIERALNAGVKRVVLGTVAVRQPAIVAEAITRFGAESISVALDSIDGKVTTHGWQTPSDTSPVELGKAMAAVGVRHALYTDVRRDGALIGPALDETIALGRDTGIQIVASGGVSSLGDVWALARSGHVAGAIIGMALYTGMLKLPDVLNAAKLAEK